MSRKSFGLIQEGGVYIPKLKHWVLTPKLDKAEVPNRTPLTFDDVEGIWEDEIRPKLAEFASMQSPEPSPPSNSRWYPNSQVPKGRIL